MAGLASLLVRTVHVLAMTALLGGSAATWAVARRGVGDLATVARAYEWAFWGAMGAVVLTGVGNLGALGPPGPGTRWGRLFQWKLLIVIAASLVRTLAVVRVTDASDAAAPPDDAAARSEDAAARPDDTAATLPDETRRFAGRAYGLTTAGVLAGVVTPGRARGPDRR